ncbi:uncharacterized protein BYT42DRAFT_554658 [Radiomyces spectabilis]|uniref:uncharacterized protein n=1 Tax=Radiomyces spectabilis TaxID=64574 RepID=UPI00221E51DB|nr:uncharacterized protein BYT42DRAFT_554658 [Radiomyces spectabilis]KAI8390879.1 hypothetical protein BYT42DRAFT_554658 [Radiomyces spectabilis]
MGLEKDTLHVVIRLPFKRPAGFVEPPPIVWTDDMEHRLWRYMSQKQTDWNAIAEQLGMPTSYVVRHAAFIHETQLRGLHQQLRLSEVGKATYTPPPSHRSTQSRPSSTNTWQGTPPSRATLQTSSIWKEPGEGVSMTATESDGQERSSQLTPTQSMPTRHDLGSSTPTSLQPLNIRDDSMMLSTISSITPRQPSSGKPTSSRTITGNDQSQLSSSDSASVGESIYKSFASSHHSRAFQSSETPGALSRSSIHSVSLGRSTSTAPKSDHDRRTDRRTDRRNIPYDEEENQGDSDDDEDDDDDDDEEDGDNEEDDEDDEQRENEDFSSHFEKMRLQLEEPAFLPARKTSYSMQNLIRSRNDISASSVSGSARPSTTMRGSHDLRQERALEEEPREDSLGMQAGGSRAGPPRQKSKQTTDKVFGPSMTRTSTASTPPFMGQTPPTGTISDDSGKENTSALNSVGSSFSDLSDTSITQSALEDAYMSKFNNGSKMSMLAFSRKYS